MSCIKKGVTSRLGEGILPLYSALARELKCWVLFWAPQYKSDMDVQEHVSAKDHSLTYEKLKELQASLQAARKKMLLQIKL